MGYDSSGINNTNYVLKNVIKVQKYILKNVYKERFHAYNKKKTYHTV